MNESNIKGVSIRSILAFIIVMSCCYVAIKVKELATLKDLAFLVLGFYFGQKTTSPSASSTQAPAPPIAAPSTLTNQKVD